LTITDRHLYAPGVARDRHAETRARGVFDRLREEILAGQLAPGTKLKAASLSERFDVSMSVVREALTRLAEQGLVLSAPHSGFQVKPVSIEDLRDLTQMRADIDAIGLRRSIERGGVDWEAGLVAAHHKLTRTQPFDGDLSRLNEAFADAHAEFHHALIAGAGSPRLLSLAASLRDSAEIYRRWSFRSARETRDVAGEHQALLGAALTRDPDRAERLIRDHLQRTADSILEELAAREAPQAAPPERPEGS
jgi:DNA-binding GntR family transcriptional regulator